MARALIEQHGGRLVYESTKGHGTTVSVDLPLDVHPSDRTSLPRGVESDAPAESKVEAQADAEAHERLARSS